MRPDHRGGIVFQKVFASTPDADIAPILALAEAKLAEPEWRKKLRAAVDRGMTFFLGYEGVYQPLARGRLKEFRFLAIALDRLEAADADV